MTSEKNETILITGGAGFIGSHVCEELLKTKNNTTIIIVDNFNNYYNPKIKRNNVKVLERHRDTNIKTHNNILNVYEGDISDLNFLKNIFESNDITKIIHLAAQAGVRYSLKNPFVYEKSNINGTLNLLELAKDYDVKTFIFGSSSSVYGNDTKAPFKEDNIQDKPISFYAATKRSGELMCYSYHHLYKLNITCLRFFTVYGERGRPDMAPFIFVDKINKGEEISMFGDGSTMRDYTYVKDIVSGIISALNKSLSFEIINLGNGNPIKLNDFISTIENILGKKAIIKQLPIPSGDVNLTYADIDKAKKLLNYNPETNIKEGMKRFVDWYLNEYQ